jgi:hypothetical protein
MAARCTKVPKKGGRRQGMIVRPSYSCPNVCRSFSKVRAGSVSQIIAGPVTKRGDGSVRRCGPPRRCVLRKARGSAARGVLCGDACGGRIGHFRLLAYWQRFCRSWESPNSSVVLPSAPVSCQHRLSQSRQVRRTSARQHGPDSAARFECKPVFN